MSLFHMIAKRSSPSADVLTSDAVRREGIRFLEVVQCNEITPTKRSQNILDKLANLVTEDAFVS